MYYNIETLVVLQNQNRINYKEEISKFLIGSLELVYVFKWNCGILLLKLFLDSINLKQLFSDKVKVTNINLHNVDINTRLLYG